MLQQHTIRLDPAISAAVLACAKDERKTPAEVMREGIRLRLEVGSLIEPVRLAILEIEDAVVARIETRIEALQAELLARVVEVAERERQTTRADFSDFIAGLEEYEKASRRQPPAKSAAIAHDPLSK